MMPRPPAFEQLFQRFLRVGSMTKLVVALRSEGMTTKGGKLIDKGYVYRILNNRVYLGEAVHKGIGLSWRASGHHRSHPLGSRARHPAGESAKARRTHSGPDPGVAQGPDLRADRQIDDAGPHAQGR